MYTSVVWERVGRVEAMVFGVFDDLELPADALPEVEESVRRKEFGGKLGELAEAFPVAGPRVFVLGLGDGGRLDVDAMRRAGLRLARRLDECEVGSAVFDFRGLPEETGLGEGLGVGLGLAAFAVKQFPGSRSEGRAERVLRVSALEEDFDRGLERGLGIARGANLARRLVNTPPNIATPLWLAEQCRELVEEVEGLDLDVVHGERLIDETMSGLLNVGRASVHPPCMVRLEWRPAGSEGRKPVVLVGKAITYDTGGLSIKSKTSMPGMKYDKSGGCAVIGAMRAVAEVVRPDYPVVGLVMAAENAISEDAYRPDDVITYRNGVTVEVTNTDAEGRLVLADGLIWACEVEDAECVVDIATLTGGVVTALGSRYAGVFGEDEELVDELVGAGSRSGEAVWRLPVDDEYRKMMEGEVADLVNSVPGGTAHASQGAAFLSCFVTKPWAHIDMAGVSHGLKEEYGFEGPSGFGVRLFAEWLSSRGGD